MKIAVLGTRGFPDVPGGVEAHCENLYPCLVKKGCEVTVFTRRHYVNPSRDDYKGVKLVPLRCVKNKFLEAFLHTFTGVLSAARISPDILHIHGIGPSLAVPLARLLGLKVVVTNHGPDYERKKWGGFARFMLALGESLGSRYSNGIICISESIADRVRKRYKKESVVIPNGAELIYAPEDESAILKYGLTKQRYVLSVGRFVPEKGFHDLIEAFNGIAGWKLVIIGDSDHPDRYSLALKTKAARNNDIILTGFLTGQALRQLYAYAGLFALPSYYEGLPIVLLEAMGHGLSCIASDIPPNREVGLAENRFFKAGDIQGLAGKIKEFIDRPLTVKEKKRQIEEIRARYNWDLIADRTLKVYRQAARARAS